MLRGARAWLVVALIFHRSQAEFQEHSFAFTPSYPVLSPVAKSSGPKVLAVCLRGARLRSSQLGCIARADAGFLLRNDSVAGYMEEFKLKVESSDSQKERLRQFEICDEAGRVSKTIREVSMEEGGIGSKVWDSGLALAMWIRLNAALIQDRKVLELGSGTGISGIFAADLAASVVLTDSEGEFAKQSKQDGLLGNLESNAQRNEDAGVLSVERLKWGESVEVLEPFDVIIGSDLIYDSSIVAPLAQTVGTYLKPGGKAILIGPQGRTGLKELQTLFASWEGSLECHSFEFFELLHTEIISTVSDAGWQWVGGREKAKKELLEVPHVKTICPANMQCRSWMVPMTLLIYTKD